LNECNVILLILAMVRYFKDVSDVWIDEMRK